MNVLYLSWDICPPSCQALRFLVLECWHSDHPPIIGFLDPQAVSLALDLLYSFPEPLICTAHHGPLLCNHVSQPLTVTHFLFFCVSVCPIDFASPEYTA